MRLCVLCGQPLKAFGRGQVLVDRHVVYHRCSGCGSLFLPEPNWLDEAYSDAISALDVGLLQRCQQLANVTTAVIASERKSRGEFLDFAGGFGTLTRLMRDRGFRFQHHDPLCRNLFAERFEGGLSGRYDLVSAFEVLEHLTDPLGTLRPVAELTDLLLVTTEVLPDPVPPPGTWPYYAEDTGQHVTFYSVSGLQSLAAGLGMQLTTSGRLVHLLHRRPLRIATRAVMRDDRLSYAVGGALTAALSRRRSRTVEDREHVARLIREQHTPRR